MLPAIALWGQTEYPLKGSVAEQGTGRALAFVSVGVQGNSLGTTTDIEGRFRLNVKDLPVTLVFTYVGYEPKTVVVNPGAETQVITVALTKKNYQIKEVVVKAGPNPAIPIIKKVVANRDKNNPEKLESYSYTSYNKLILTANNDSLTKMKGDTSKEKVMKFFERTHLFLLETVTKKKFIAPNLSNEDITGIRASGFKDPSFMALATQLQSFTFYNELIELGDKAYINPVSKNSENKYLFVLEDTLYEKGDSIYVISFAPRTGKNFDAMTGVLYINTNGYAIQNVIAKPAEEDNFGIKIQQKYELIDGKKWFPVQLNTDLMFKNAQFNQANLVGIGRTYLSEIKIEPELKRSDFITIDMVLDPRATEKDDKFWDMHRPDTLDRRERNTYVVIDSLGDANNLDKKLRSFIALSNGRIPIKSIDLELDKIIRYNRYEGFRLGLGFHTNSRFSRVVTTGGYFAYGFSDKAFKWGYDVSVRVLKRPDLKIKALWMSDVMESAQPEIRGMRPAPYIERIRRAYVNRMDFLNRGEVNISFRTAGYLRFNVFGARTKVDTKFDYGFTSSADDTVGVSKYTFTEAGVSVRFAFKEKLFDTGKFVASLGTEYPVVYIQYTRGLTGILDGAYAYNRIDLKTEKTFRLKNLGNPSFQLWAGYIDRPAPYILNYTNRSSYGPNPYVASMYSFETMRINEFLSDTYVNLFFRHNFRSLLYKSKRFRPQFVLVQNMGWGKMSHPERHRLADFKTMEKGFFESGMLINDIYKSGLSGLGVGAFYRYGPNSPPKWNDNIAVKLSLNLAF